MRIDDDSVRAAHAAQALIHLYDAYRANARAQIAAIQQVRRHRKTGGADPLQLAELDRREALFRQTDAVYAVRREQVRRRLYELLDIPELP